MSAAEQLSLGLVADAIAVAHAPAPASTAADSSTEPRLGDRIMAALNRQVALAEQQERELKELLAEIEGVPVDQLDGHLAAQEAQRKAELDAIRAQRAPRSPLGSSKEEPVSDRIGASALTERQRELLTNVRVESNVAIYAREERIPDWDLLKRVMVALGGKWRSRKGFVFPDDIDAQELVRLAIDTGEILDPRAADFFETPRELAERIVALAEIRSSDIVLEPSAGRGALALAVRRACPGAEIVCCEALPDNRVALEKHGFSVLYEHDFLRYEPSHSFDAIVMNPPFSGRADLVHVARALRFLVPGGSLVAIMSAGTKWRDDKKARAFRALVEKHGGRFEDNPDGSFLESGTGVRTVTLVIPRTR